MKKIHALLWLGFAMCAPIICADEEKVPTPEATVLKLYKEHLQQKGALWNRKGENIWSFMFSPDLVKLFKQDYWGFDPLWFAQDFEIKNLKVKTLHSDGKGRALVLVTFLNFNEPVRLIVSTLETDHAQRIENIVMPESGTDLLNDFGGEADKGD